MKPMLAYPFVKDKQTYPCFVQPKLDGLRALWLKDQLQSRDGHLWLKVRLPHIFNELEEYFHGNLLDCELYCHGISLQEINSRAGVVGKSPHSLHETISCNIFDVIADKPLHERVSQLQIIADHIAINNLKHITVVDTHYCTSYEELQRIHSYYTSQGYEGSMVKDYNASYGFAHKCGNKQNRWTTMRKLKENGTIIVPVVNYVPGTGKYSHSIGSLVCQLPNNHRLHVGTGLTDSQRNLWYQHPNLILGKSVKIKYRTMSESDIPLEPRLVEVL